MSGLIDFENYFYFNMSEKTAASNLMWDLEYQSLLNELLSIRPDLIPSAPDPPPIAAQTNETMDMPSSIPSTGASGDSTNLRAQMHPLQNSQYQHYDSCLQQHNSFIPQQPQHDHMGQVLQQSPQQQQMNQQFQQQQMTQQHQQMNQQQQQLQQHTFNMNDLMHSAFSELRMIVEWARKVPKFATLQMADRVSMLKSSFVDLYLLRLVFRSASTNGRLMFTDKMFMTSEECVDLGWSPEVIMSCFSLVNQFKRLEVDLNEFAILCAIILFYPDAPGLCNRSQVLENQNKLISCLQQYSSFRFPGNNTRPGRIVMRLAGIRSVSVGVLHQFVRCTREGQIQMDDLVIEMMS